MIFGKRSRNMSENDRFVKAQAGKKLAKRDSSDTMSKPNIATPAAAQAKHSGRVHLGALGTAKKALK